MKSTDKDKFQDKSSSLGKDKTTGGGVSGQHPGGIKPTTGGTGTATQWDKSKTTKEQPWDKSGKQ